MSTDVLLFLVLENDFQPSIVYCGSGCRPAIYKADTLLRYIASIPNSLEVFIVQKAGLCQGFLHEFRWSYGSVSSVHMMCHSY